MTAPKDKEQLESILHGFHGIPFKSELEAMSDIELAELQNNLPTNSPGTKLIEKEWQRRMPSTPKKEWHERILSKVSISILSSLLVAYLVYRFGWK